MKLPLILILLSTFNFANAEEGLRLFQSDGCSYFPDGTFARKNLWLKCCVEHDKAYWMGGTYQQRKTADKALKKCVAEVGKPGIALLMYLGVRVGGTPYLPTKFRWGYGWTYLRGYKALTAKDKQEVETLDKKSTIGQ